MKEARLAIRVDEALARRVKAYASRHNTTLTLVVTKLLEELVASDDRAHGSTETVDAEQA